MRSRLEGLTDDEYFWEPRPGWNLRLRGQRAAANDEGYIQAGSGDYVIDFASPEPVPAPFTTIAWRIGHLLVGVLGARVAGGDHPPRCRDLPPAGPLGEPAAGLRIRMAGCRSRRDLMH